MEHIGKKLQENLKKAEEAKSTRNTHMLAQIQAMTMELEVQGRELHERTIRENNLEEKLQRMAQLPSIEKTGRIREFIKYRYGNEELRCQWHEKIEEREKWTQQYVTELYRLRQLRILNGKEVDKDRVGSHSIEYEWTDPINWNCVPNQF